MRAGMDGWKHPQRNATQRNTLSIYPDNKVVEKGQMKMNGYWWNSFVSRGRGREGGKKEREGVCCRNAKRKDAVWEEGCSRDAGVQGRGGEERVPREGEGGERRKGGRRRVGWGTLSEGGKAYSPTPDHILPSRSCREGEI